MCVYIIICKLLIIYYRYNILYNVFNIEIEYRVHNIYIGIHFTYIGNRYKIQVEKHTILLYYIINII